MLSISNHSIIEYSFVLLYIFIKFWQHCDMIIWFDALYPHIRFVYISFEGVVKLHMWKSLIQHIYDKTHHPSLQYSYTNSDSHSLHIWKCVAADYQEKNNNINTYTNRQINIKVIPHVDPNLVPLFALLTIKMRRIFLIGLQYSILHVYDIGIAEILFSNPKNILRNVCTWDNSI